MRLVAGGEPERVCDTCVGTPASAATKKVEAATKKKSVVAAAAAANAKAAQAKAVSAAAKMKVAVAANAKAQATAKAAAAAAAAAKAKGKATYLNLNGACFSGDAARVRAMLVGGLSANGKPTPGEGETRPEMLPIHLAAYAGHADTIGVLVDANADVNARSAAARGGLSALQFAAVGGHVNSIRRLLDAGADPNTTMPLGQGADADKIVARLREKQTTMFGSPQAPDDASPMCERHVNRRETEVRADGIAPALAVALSKAFLEPFSLPGCGADVTARALECARLLIAGKADVNASLSRSFDMTLLHSAASTGSVQVVQMLLDAGADASKLDVTGRTPAAHAAEMGHTDCARLLGGVDLEAIADGGGDKDAPATFAVAASGATAAERLKAFTKHRDMLLAEVDALEALNAMADAELCDVPPPPEYVDVDEDDADDAIVGGSVAHAVDDDDADADDDVDVDNDDVDGEAMVCGNTEDAVVTVIADSGCIDDSKPVNLISIGAGADASEEQEAEEEEDEPVNETNEKERKVLVMM
jgi:hypothetical protein